ncbi:MAG: hypothetical protein ACI3XI_08785, partial [Eubacteriales bacterium]
MKKILSIILSVSMILTLAAAMGLTIAAAPEGTAVNSAAEFAAMEATGTYYLAADITLDATYAGVFSGTFDGNGKTVTTTVPMFGTVENATIKNLNVTGEINVTETTAYVDDAGTPNDFIAAVAVLANGTSGFDGITSEVKITCTTDNTRAAAVAAWSAEGSVITITNCVNKGDISVKKYAGGVYGWTDKNITAKFENCVNYGKITSTAGYVSGVVNRVSNTAGSAEIKNCANYGAITGTTQIAGIISYGSGALTIENCINTADVTRIDTAVKTHAAGILGLTQANAGNVMIIKNCTNTGNITGDTGIGSNCSGGIVGYVNNNALIVEYCLNTGDVIGDYAAGGICGRVNHKGTYKEGDVAIQAAFRNCVNLGNVTADLTAGGISGRNGVTGGVGVFEFSHCVNKGDVTVITSSLEASVTNADTGVAGIAGHNRAKASEGSKLVIKDCLTTGNITAAETAVRAPAYLIGYCGGGAEIETSGNYVSGTLSGGTVGAVGLAYVKAYDCADGTFSGNFVPTGYSYPISVEKSATHSTTDETPKYTATTFELSALVCDHNYPTVDVDAEAPT